MNAVTDTIATDAGRLDKHYETRCILEGQRRLSMNIYDEDLQAFAALFNERCVIRSPVLTVSHPPLADLHQKANSSHLLSKSRTFRNGVKV